MIIFFLEKKETNQNKIYIQKKIMLLTIKYISKVRYNVGIINFTEKIKKLKGNRYQYIDIQFIRILKIK